ncbi:MAG: hypothetical protein ISN28_14265 [Ectothiorhodospiraceae bacterium AqS1]|nr:hypothetical protein [Ectothiorhodospiraceae bacterium AqS1]
MPLSKEAHPWLDYDSFLRCGGELIRTSSEKDFIYLLEKQKNPERQGILGRIDEALMSDVCISMAHSTNLTSDQKEIISDELGC